MHACVCVRDESSVIASDVLTKVLLLSLNNYISLVMSQFPPEITEKLTVIGGGGISLDRRTVLAGMYR